MSNTDSVITTDEKADNEILNSLTNLLDIASDERYFRRDKAGQFGLDIVNKTADKTQEIAENIMKIFSGNKGILQEIIKAGDIVDQMQKLIEKLRIEYNSPGSGQSGEREKDTPFGRLLNNGFRELLTRNKLWKEKGQQKVLTQNQITNILYGFVNGLLKPPSMSNQVKAGIKAFTPKDKDLDVTNNIRYLNDLRTSKKIKSNKAFDTFLYSFINDFMSGGKDFDSSVFKEIHEWNPEDLSTISDLRRRNMIKIIDIMREKMVKGENPTAIREYLRESSFLTEGDFNIFNEKEHGELISDIENNTSMSMDSVIGKLIPSSYYGASRRKGQAYHSSLIDSMLLSQVLQVLQNKKVLGKKVGNVDTEFDPESGKLLSATYTDDENNIYTYVTEDKKGLSNVQLEKLQNEENLLDTYNGKTLEDNGQKFSVKKLSLNALMDRINTDAEEGKQIYAYNKGFDETKLKELELINKDVYFKEAMDIANGLKEGSVEKLSSGILLENEREKISKSEANNIISKTGGIAKRFLKSIFNLQYEKLDYQEYNKQKKEVEKELENNKKFNSTTSNEKTSTQGTGTAEEVKKLVKGVKKQPASDEAGAENQADNKLLSDKLFTEFQKIITKNPNIQGGIGEIDPETELALIKLGSNLHTREDLEKIFSKVSPLNKKLSKDDMIKEMSKVSNINKFTGFKNEALVSYQNKLNNWIRSLKKGKDSDQDITDFLIGYGFDEKNVRKSLNNYNRELAVQNYDKINNFLNKLQHQRGEYFNAEQMLNDIFFNPGKLKSYAVDGMNLETLLKDTGLMSEDGVVDVGALTPYAKNSIVVMSNAFKKFWANKQRDQQRFLENFVQKLDDEELLQIASGQEMQSESYSNLPSYMIKDMDSGKLHKTANTEVARRAKQDRNLQSLIGLQASNIVDAASKLKTGKTPSEKVAAYLSTLDRGNLFERYGSLLAQAGIDPDTDLEKSNRKKLVEKIENAEPFKQIFEKNREEIVGNLIKSLMDNKEFSVTTKLQQLTSLRGDGKNKQFGSNIENLQNQMKVGALEYFGGDSTSKINEDSFKAVAQYELGGKGIKQIIREIEHRDKKGRRINPYISTSNTSKLSNEGEQLLKQANDILRQRDIYGERTLDEDEESFVRRKLNNEDISNVINSLGETYGTAVKQVIYGNKNDLSTTKGLFNNLAEYGEEGLRSKLVDNIKFGDNVEEEERQEVLGKIDKIVGYLSNIQKNAQKEVDFQLKTSGTYTNTNDIFLGKTDSAIARQQAKSNFQNIFPNLRYLIPSGEQSFSERWEKFSQNWNEKSNVTARQSKVNRNLTELAKSSFINTISSLTQMAVSSFIKQSSYLQSANTLGGRNRSQFRNNLGNLISNGVGIIGSGVGTALTGSPLIGFMVGQGINKVGKIASNVITSGTSRTQRIREYAENFYNQRDQYVNNFLNDGAFSSGERWANSYNKIIGFNHTENLSNPDSANSRFMQNVRKSYIKAQRYLAKHGTLEGFEDDYKDYVVRNDNGDLSIGSDDYIQMAINRRNNGMGEDTVNFVSNVLRNNGLEDNAVNSRAVLDTILSGRDDTKLLNNLSPEDRKLYNHLRNIADNPELRDQLIEQANNWITAHQANALDTRENSNNRIELYEPMQEERANVVSNIVDQTDYKKDYYAKMGTQLSDSIKDATALKTSQTIMGDLKAQNELISNEYKYSLDLTKDMAENVSKIFEEMNKNVLNSLRSIRKGIPPVAYPITQEQYETLLDRSGTFSEKIGNALHRTLDFLLDLK